MITLSFCNYMGKFTIKNKLVDYDKPKIFNIRRNYFHAIYVNTLVSFYLFQIKVVSKVKLKLILTFIFFFVLAVPAHAAPVSYGEINFKVKDNDSTMTFGFTMLQKNGTVYMPLEFIDQKYSYSMHTGLTVTYRANSKIFPSLKDSKLTSKSKIYGILTGWQKQVTVLAGSKNATVDHKKVSMEAAAILDKGDIYVPVSFLFKALEIKAKYDSATKTYNIDSLPNYAYSTSTFENKTYEVRFNPAEVYVKDNKGARTLLAKLSQPINETALMKFIKTPKGSLIVTISEFYGITIGSTDIHTLLFKENKLIRQMHAHYLFRSGKNINLVGSQIILTDGKKAEIIDDNTGKTIQTLDLVELGGKDDDYAIEGLGDRYILIRPASTGLLTLVQLNSNSKTQLYEKLLDADEQKAALNPGEFFRGDTLTFVKQEGNVLYFSKYDPKTGKPTKQLYPYALDEKPAATS